MIVDRYDPVNLFELVPTKLRLEMEPELAALDRLLEDDELFVGLKADFSKPRPNSSRLGRRSTPVEVILRMVLLRRLYDWSFEATERNVSDSLVLRQFCRLYLEPAIASFARPRPVLVLLDWFGNVPARYYLRSAQVPFLVAGFAGISASHGGPLTVRE